MARIYGWRPDKPDVRDHKYELTLFASLPSKVDLRPICSAVKDQGDLGSCTGNAIASAIEFLDIKKKVKIFHNYSRLFIYYNERVLENSINYDSGAEIRDGIKSINKWGCCYESTWPYIISRFAAKPGSNCYIEARTHLINKYQRLTTLDQFKNCLASGYPFVYGFTVYDGFESDEVAKTGVVQMPKTNENVLGGHAVLAVGYDDSTRTFLTKNSWGTNWGQKGYFTIPYDYLTNPDLADDFWVIKG